jgi:chromosome partitioning protein
VLLVDLDQQPSAFGWYQARAQKTGLVVVPTHHAAVRQLIVDAERDKLDLVIIDTPPTTEGGAPKAAVDAADITLIPCQPCAHDLRAIQDTLELCRGRGVTPVVVLNEVEANSPLTEEARSALKEMGVRVLQQMVGARRAFKHTATDGRAVTEFDGRGKAAEDIRALYRAISRLQSKSK